MFPIFSAILGVSQLSGLAVFPLLSKKFDRKTLYTGAIISIVIGYLLFFFAPTNTMLFIGIAGVFIFFGQAFIQLLMTMFIADSVDYGHWKLKKRNDSITFSLQPLIYKLGGAIGSGVVLVVVILSGISAIEEREKAASEIVAIERTIVIEATDANMEEIILEDVDNVVEYDIIEEADTIDEINVADFVTPEGRRMVKFAMLIFPLLCILLSYIIYRWKFKIDAKFYAQILADLRERGEITQE